MLCNSCSKLLALPSQKMCLRCRGTILLNLSVICDGCSMAEKMCSICLKKLVEAVGRIKPRGNCGSCGG